MTSLQVAAAPGEGSAEWMSRATASSGRIYFWQGGSLWIGAGRGRTQWHAHHAHQIALAPQGQFRFRTENGGGWTDFEAALVPSHRAHQFELDGIAIAHLFVEPESRAGRVLAARFGSDEVAALPVADTQPLARALFAAFAADASRVPMVRAAERALAALCGSASEAEAEAARAVDPRLERALAFMRQHLRRPISLAEVAAAAALSESRFRHLFVAQTGSSFRAYLLWLRINLAIEAVMAGASWTEAAHEAGFADSAHLTRTHRRMFGIEPSAVRPLPVDRADA